MRKKGRIELAARALCRHRGLLENTTFEGKPMWFSMVPEVKVVLEAALTIEELERLLAPEQDGKP